MRFRRCLAPLDSLTVFLVFATRGGMETICRGAFHSNEIGRWLPVPLDERGKIEKQWAISPDVFNKNDCVLSIIIFANHNETN